MGEVGGRFAGEVREREQRRVGCGDEQVMAGAVAVAAGLPRELRGKDGENGPDQTRADNEPDHEFASSVTRDYL
ncbi:hypothetical protein [Rhodococcus sp. SJ-3]|uniref:hypothetical protein n=1 Tax=Rhodococcus sp. SJ-3 TaxID=3454628 RepID=UPI000ABF02DE